MFLKILNDTYPFEKKHQENPIFIENEWKWKRKKWRGKNRKEEKEMKANQLSKNNGLEVWNIGQYTSETSEVFCVRSKIM